MAITQTSDVTYDQAAYDRATYFALRDELIFDALATVKPTAQAMPGSSVVFDKASDLAQATTPLTEDTDVTAQTMGNTAVTVTLAEYGSAAGVTRKLQGVSYLGLDPVLANIVGFNAGDSIDQVAQNVMVAGTNVVYAGTATSRVTVAATDIITATRVRKVKASLRASNVMRFGRYYAAVIHPYVALDLREQTGAAAWRDPHTYSSPEMIWNGELGEFEGFRFVESSRATNFANAGVGGTVDVYATLFLGQQAVAKAWSTAPGFGPFPKMVVSPVTDKLRRFAHVGWYWLGGYGRFREEALYRIEAASSIGANT